jgi:hypothetical protein
MRNTFPAKLARGLYVPLALLFPLLLHQNAGAQQNENTTNSSQPSQPADLATIASLLQELQAEVHDLRSQVSSLNIQQESARAETVALRKELEQSNPRFAASRDSVTTIGLVQCTGPCPEAQESTEDRIAKLEEDIKLADAKIAEQSQTKVESSSKYRVRLSGIVLFNMFGERGHTDNSDFPQFAVPPDPLASGGSFGAAIRQSQIGFEAFGPTIAGARTSADIHFDLSGGFPGTQNGVSFGILRLRTGTFRFDWQNTSLVGGQDSLFFAPLNPTSLATLATPALAYSGNLWSWTPQIRVEHRIALSESSTVLLQGGILDNLTGDLPSSTYTRSPSWGEYSGQPAFAARVAWMHKLGEQDLTFGAGGYYSRQIWGFGRTVDGWAGTMDLKLPLGRKFEFTGQFYRGRAVGGIGGGLGQTAVWKAPFSSSSTEVYGLNSAGGWAQIKYRAIPKLQFNAALGQDNPLASDLRNLGGNGAYTGQLLSKNQTAFVNFIFQPRSDFEFSVEYRKLKTFILDSNPDTANRVNLSVGYIF